ncbi:MAG: hypothetical protein ABIN96_09470 [Rubrivivax sp.]
MADGQSGREGDGDGHGNLGFEVRQRKDGSLQILHHGRLATTLRGTAAADFPLELQGCSVADAQQSMARLTGNYKRGNERLAAAHLRNQR